MYHRVIWTSRPRRVWSRASHWVPRLATGYVVVGLDFVVKVRYQPWRGLWWWEMRDGRDGLGAVLSTREQPEWTMRKVVIGGSEGAESVNHLAAIETELLRCLPNVVAHCCLTRYADKSPRRPGWITIKVMGAAWVCQVKDPDSCAQMQCTAQSLDDALALADVLLGSEQAPWEPDPFLRKQESTKKK